MSDAASNMSTTDPVYLIVPWDNQRRGVSSQARSHISRFNQRVIKLQGRPQTVRRDTKRTRNQGTAVPLDGTTLVAPPENEENVEDPGTYQDLCASEEPAHEASELCDNNPGQAQVSPVEKMEQPDAAVQHASRQDSPANIKQMALQPENLLMNAFNPINQDFLSYFKHNAKDMLHLGHCADSKRAEGIVHTLITYALSGTWCFGTVVILLSANHLNFESGHEAPDKFTRTYIDLIREESLRCASNRVRAVGERGVSGDDDVLALLFLATAECLYGDFERGQVHMKGWEAYMNERRIQCVRPCTKAVEEVLRWVCGLIPM